ncbi:neuroendocrine convertase 1-like [Acanthaster planci]|uniref:SPC3 n=1 Tax=Acanthaster planci TaxID=133434 RepID=A0A8B7ZSE9_ACAPL|nr:neuroendocrine convertase 1-like [Acanthaster planci]
MNVFHHGSFQVCFLLLCAFLSNAVAFENPWSDTDDLGSYFTNEFAVQIEGGIDVARSVASDHGYQLQMQIGSLPDHYLLQHDETPSRSKRETDERHTKKLADDHRVLWFQQQEAKRRTKRNVDKRFLRSTDFNDPLYEEEWYLNGDYKEQRGMQPDMNVRQLWEKGITGKGVVVSIVDDGLEVAHSDIAKNYDPLASWNFKEKRNDPTPPKSTYNHNGHGTRCAGEVAMVADNGKCGVGIAYEANIGGIRILEGKITDAVESASLSYNLDHIDIFSSSWGPTDDGMTTDGPGPLTKKALEEGIKRGRNSKGVLYAWASGNGGSEDNCNCDAYSSSIYTIATSSVSETGQKTFYGETCSSILTTSYSSGSGKARGVVSASLHNQCTNDHGGTSASAPMTAGVLALLLQANPDVTWRDAQHIIVQTSNTRLLREAEGVEWRRNAAGHVFSDYFGFGLLDAEAMVDLANPESWMSVPEKSVCTIKAGPSFTERKLTRNQPIKLDIVTDGCEGTSDEVTYLEHVIFSVSIDYSRRGALNVHLTSPSGTKTKLLTERREDSSDESMDNFPLMSVQLWGEQAAIGDGVWKLDIFDSTLEDISVGHNGYLRDWRLELHGTKELPKYVNSARGP